MLTFTDKYKTPFRIISCLLIVIQAVLLSLYFLDTCHSYKEEACSTLVAEWPVWALFLPTITGWIGFAVFLFLDKRYQRLSTDSYLLASTFR